MKKQMLILMLFAVGFFLFAEDVTFNVNMNYQVELGNFDFESDFVDVAGNFNEWAGSDSLLDEDNDGIYSITISDLEIDYICEYKFRINGSWDNAEFPGGGENRLYTVVEGENIVDHWFNDQEPPSGDPALITFIVDNSLALSFTGFYLKGSWDSNGVYDPEWGDGIEHTAFFDDGTNGDETADDQIWTVVVELYPDDGANTWQWGVNDQDHNWIDGNFEFQIIDDSPQTLSYEIPSATEQDVTVLFQVDMSLIPEVLEVYIAGDFNGWSSTETIMSDDDMDWIYSVNVLFPAGSDRLQSYKYINGSDWEMVENRIFEIDDSNDSQILDPVYFNDLTPDDFITQDVTVTFQLSMEFVEEIGMVTIAGDFNSWNTTDFILTDENEDLVYVIDHLFTAGSYKYSGYKYLNDEVYEDIENRMLEIDDSNSTQVLDIVYFENSQSATENTVIPVVQSLTNYPNPFNPSTTIEFILSQNTFVNAYIYNLKGQQIQTLAQQPYQAGTHQIFWDGTDKNLRKVASGLYLFKLETDRRYTSTKKLILMK